MKRKIIAIILTLIIIPLIILGIYKMFELLEYRSNLSNLDEYTLDQNEKIVKEFEYNNKKYTISMNYGNKGSWGDVNFLLKENKKYYKIKNIKSCDMSEEGSNLYIRDNEIYIHCIGKEGNIDKYLIDHFNIEEEKLNFNYENTPNISQLHIGIDKVDNEYIYLSSPFKNDDTSNNEPKVKCSLEDKICNYY